MWWMWCVFPCRVISLKGWIGLRSGEGDVACSKTSARNGVFFGGMVVLKSFIAAKFIWFYGLTWPCTSNLAQCDCVSFLVMAVMVVVVVVVVLLLLIIILLLILLVLVYVLGCTKLFDPNIWSQNAQFQYLKIQVQFIVPSATVTAPELRIFAKRMYPHN